MSSRAGGTDLRFGECGGGRRVVAALRDRLRGRHQRRQGELLYVCRAAAEQVACMQPPAQRLLVTLLIRLEQ